MTVWLSLTSTTEGFKINANIQPFLLNDTYAADLTLFPESPDISIDIPQLQFFQPGSLIPSNIQASLGQTLWIYGEVDANENCQELANQCAVALCAGTNSNPILVNQSEIFGSLLFEYQATDPDEPQNMVKKSHILICLNNNQAQTLPLAGRAYDWLLNLLCSHHKILYIYQQACDRPLERTFQVLGTAFGGGAIVSGVVTQHIEKPFAPTININYPVHPLISSLLWSVLATIIFGMVAWLVTKPKQK